MKNKKRLNEIISSVLWTPETMLLFLFSVGSIFWGIYKYSLQRTAKWNETMATLVHVDLNDRIRNKKAEQFLKLTYEYEINEIKYLKYEDMVLEFENDSIQLKKDIENTRRTATLYYNSNNLSDTTLQLEETRVDSGLFVVVLPTILLIAGACYWGLKLGYKNAGS